MRALNRIPEEQMQYYRRKPSFVAAVQVEEDTHIDTGACVLFVPAGDYLVRKENGTVFRMSAAEFERTHDYVNGYVSLDGVVRLSPSRIVRTN